MYHKRPNTHAKYLIFLINANLRCLSELLYLRTFNIIHLVILYKDIFYNYTFDTFKRG